MKFRLMPHLRESVLDTAQNMNKGHLDKCDIPDGPGMTLFRSTSGEYQRFSAENPDIPFLPVIVAGERFMISMFGGGS